MNRKATKENPRELVEQPIALVPKRARLRIWRVGKLEEELQAGSVTDFQFFLYFLIFLALYGFPFPFLDDSSPSSSYTLIALWVSFAGTMIAKTLPSD